MISKYGIFCKVIETGSFTRTSEQLDYSQSAISQAIKALEQELGTVLVNRKKDGITLTLDGEQFLPYIQEIASAETALEQKKQDMQGLKNSTIRIGTFTSVSRNLLPELMKKFKKIYPDVHFVLSQGEYTTIEHWIKEGTVDFGFMNADAVAGIDTEILYKDKMMAVLPEHHVLSKNKEISLLQLVGEPFILLDEGSYSLPLEEFKKKGIALDVEYKVYDDYSILAMVREGLGVSMMYEKVLSGFEAGLAIRPIIENPERKVAIGWKNWDTLPFATRKFIEFVKGGHFY